MTHVSVFLVVAVQFPAGLTWQFLGTTRRKKVRKNNASDSAGTSPPHFEHTYGIISRYLPIPLVTQPASTGKRLCRNPHGPL